MKKKLIALVSAGVLALVGVFALVSYANGANDRAYGEARLVEVWVVKSDIPADTPSERIAGSIEAKKVPVAVRATGALADLDAVKGLSTNTALKPGEQLIKARFGAVAGKGAPTDLPAGMQEVSLSLAAPRTPTGEVKVGDRVGLIASYTAKDGSGGFTNVVKNNLLVTRVSTSALAAAGANEAGVPILVTFAVKPLDAEKIINAAEFGKVWLTLQNSQTDTGGSQRIDSKDVIE